MEIIILKMTILITMTLFQSAAHAFLLLAGFALITVTVFLRAVEMTFVLEMKNANTMNQQKL